MADRHHVGAATDLADDGARVVADVGGLEVAVFRIDGSYHAVANFCPHQGGPLCEGNLRGRTVPGDDGWSWGYDDEEKYVACPWHAWKFDVTTGDCANAPEYSVPTYDVELEDGEVYVTR